MDTNNFYQANINGTVELSEQPSGPNKSEIIDIISESLNKNGWNIQNSETRTQPYKFKIYSHDFYMDIYIYSWRISNGGRPSRPYEQRIQIGSSAGDEGFYIDNSDPTKKGLLLGIYKREDGDPIIVAWETEKNRNHGSSKSCFVDVRSIALAMRDGFVQTRDTDGNLICVFKMEFLNYYILNLKMLHNMDFLSTTYLDNINETSSELENSGVNGGTNKIIYGAPGVGKSYSLGKEGNRVTFHPEYTYFEFVGGLKPGTNEEGEVSYEFVPGPLLQALKEAYDNPGKMYTLIIEEINRANTAAVFGDIFQLLDRDINGWSEYSIKNKDILSYLNRNRCDFLTEVKIPGNLNLFATMNSADQGVFAMDSAFKRRWEFEYLGISFINAEHSETSIRYAGYEITWFNFASTINKYLSSRLDVNEDKLIGPYFIKKNELKDNKKIAYKLLIYLWDDVVRHQRNELFNEKYSTFSEISEVFIAGKQSIFVEELDELLQKKIIIDEMDHRPYE